MPGKIRFVVDLNSRGKDILLLEIYCAVSNYDTKHSYIRNSNGIEITRDFRVFRITCMFI